MKKLAIVDIDGTIADLSHRAHLVDRKPTKQKWKRFLDPDLIIKDRPIKHAQRVLAEMDSLGWEIVFLTGRNTGLCEVTRRWLDIWFPALSGYAMHMRDEGDQRPVSQIKDEHLARLLPLYRRYTVMAFDDDPYNHQVYAKRGILYMRAPNCWKHMYPEVGSLPREKRWKR